MALGRAMRRKDKIGMPADSNFEASRINRLAAANIAVALVVIAIKYLAYLVSGSVALFSDALESVVNVMVGISRLRARNTSATEPPREGA